MKGIWAPIILIAVTSACMSQMSPPQPIDRSSGQPGIDADPNDPYGGLGRETFLSGQRLVGGWDGLNDQLPPDSRWQIETRTPQGSAGTGDIQISLMHPVDLKNESYQFLLSAPRQSTGVELCEGECSAPGVKTYPAQYVYFNEGRKFYWMNAKALVEDGLRLEFRYLGPNQAVGGQRAVEFVRKGTTRNRPSPQPSAIPTGSPGPVAISLAEAKLLINQYCGGGGCHNNYAQNPLVMSKSDSLNRINSGNMPRGRNLVGQDRDRLIAWLRQP
jgi:hypothetical protein